jgi:hypothetical protein
MNDPRKGTRTARERERERGRRRRRRRNCEVMRQFMAYSEIAYEKGWKKGTNHSSWPFRNNTSPNQKAIAIADSTENQFTSHDLCDENHERVWSRLKAVLSSVDDNSFGRVRPCDLHKVVNTLQLRKAFGLMVFQMNALGFFQEDH